MKDKTAELYNKAIEDVIKKFIKNLGDNKRQFTIWNDGGEWLISIKGQEQEKCKSIMDLFY